MIEKPSKPKPNRESSRVPDILDVGMAAAFLTVSRDAVYQFFRSGELPGRKVGRKWVTTKAAVLRWVENSAMDDSLARAVERGDRDALNKAFKDGKVRVRANSPHGE